MYLKTLTLRGFKSFASTTTLAFEPGITCVVGPNGSGKSNVVDALSWVMGEQGAKTLRGQKMEDVIFAGTSSRAPLGRAEVVLTIDNTDGALPIEYTEVTISRTMFRSGGSEYAINGQTARLLDVQELLSDSGIGRKMHVIVGQGQLDTILSATPEARRGFIEEAAGVLKHRVRKEKAVRKLDATQANVVRLTDLLTELRRQLKPLGRQADVARKAAVIQADVRDAQARLWADDLQQARDELSTEKAQSATELAARQALEDELTRIRHEETAAEKLAQQHAPIAARIQQSWYALAALRERFSAVVSISTDRERVATAQAATQRTGRDLAAVERERITAEDVRENLTREQAALTDSVARAATATAQAESDVAEAERRIGDHHRAVADQREGLARLTGEVKVLQSRVDTAAARIDNLDTSIELARTSSARATETYRALEITIAEMMAGESGLDTEHEAAEQIAAALESKLQEQHDAERIAVQEQSALTARLEGLSAAVENVDATESVRRTAGVGVGDQLVDVLAVEPGYEAAVAAVLSDATQAVAADNLAVVERVLTQLRSGESGRISLITANIGGPDTSSWPPLPGNARYLCEVILVPDSVRGAVNALLDKVVVVNDLVQARRVVEQVPGIRTVTRVGDLVGEHFSSGGGDAGLSQIELKAHISATRDALAVADQTVERTRFSIAELTDKHAQAEKRVEAALARLHESDAQMEAVSEQLSHASQRASAANKQAEELATERQEAVHTYERFTAALEQSSRRLDRAESVEIDAPVDIDGKEALVSAAQQARERQSELSLELRTVEERLRAVTSRIETLRVTVETENKARIQHAERRRKLEEQATQARAVAVAAQWAADVTQTLVERTEADRQTADQARADADATANRLRNDSRTLAAQFEQLVATQYQGEARITACEQRIESVSEKSWDELGIDAETLRSEYGPHQPVPVAGSQDKQEWVPYDREEQQLRLARASKQLSVLGKINPLALEEFEAMQERHTFLAEQLEDVKRTQADLRGIIDEIDARVEQVFAAAYEDVAVAFEHAVTRLFPGGEGRLVLTDPQNLLLTGIDMEVRPAGKKLKRLSLLSGGERSLVAVGFLVALFTARPSPFYILDEVEAALDDTNLGRLLEIYEELRADSQLIVITHQKRTMEIADALYGVTMRSDGVSAVISERLREG